ncbi:Neurotrypsin [Camponotus japonicus]
MMLCLKHFLLVICLVYLAVFSSAIYDPSATTTKPPERRESILPWNVIQNKSRIQIESPSSKWQQQSRDNIPRSDTKNWSPWRKASGGEIEQRTQLENYGPVQVPEQISENIPEQQHNLEFDKLDQRQNLKPPIEYRDFTNYFENESNYGNRNRPQNEIDFDHKYPQRNDGNKELNVGLQNEDFYEGVAIDSTKPRRENIVLSHKPRHKVAKYDSRLGVQCPDHNSTGQFVYPPDCKFFVNCWQGRAFVQPCAPNTHFNPDTLECDFPHKVKCYENESADFRQSLDSESQINRKSQKLTEPKCPPYLIGLLPHYRDCTKFIQCANGVTYIMDCGPGTVFNPTIGVCDWPRNVKGCEDIFKSDEDDKMPFAPINPNFGRDKSSYTEVKKITCPADFTGLLAHPETCKKFLQCANGVTYIMDCGPGTVFNPTFSVCDWPRNVKGCEDNFKSDEDDKMPFAPINPNFGRDKSSYTEVKKITCPADFTGLLPHPETCKKFLQCANGVTYIMDCGPGTAFNPITIVCDWPYNVPSCKTDKSDGVYKTGASTWSPSAEARGTMSWSNSGHYNRTTNTRDHISQSRYRYSTTMSSIFRPTWRPFTTTPRTRWIPKWTTARPFYNHSKHIPDYHDRYDDVREEKQYKGHGSHHSEWKPSRNLGRPSGSNYGSQYGSHHPDWQQVGNDQEPQGTYHTDRPEESWVHAYKNPDYHYSHYPPGYHHHHHHHYHNYGPTSNPSEDTNWANPAVTNDQKYNQGYYTPNTDSNWRPSYNYDHNSRHYDYPHFEHAAPNKTDQRQFQLPERNDEDNIQFHHRYNETKFDTDGMSANRKTDYDFSLNRQNYGRTIPGLYHPNFNRTSSSVGNIFPNNNNKSTENWDQIQDGLRQDKQSPPWIGQENIVWNQPNRSNFKPSTWHGQENPGNVQTENQTYPWDQGTISQTDKSFSQSTIDREADTKMTQWATRTNVFLNSKSQVNLAESKSTTQYPKTNLYPNGIYVNAGGIKGHYITKDIENNEGGLRIHEPYNVHKPISWNNTFNSTNSNYASFTTETPMTTTPKKISNKQSELSRRGRDFVNITSESELHNFDNTNEDNLPNVSIEQDDYWGASDTKISNVDSATPNVIEPEINDYDVDVLDDKNVWKPRLVFENKTKTTTASSVIMKIGPKNTDVELFNIEAAPFQEEESPFPVYYIQPVQPLTHSKKSVRPTPISGQVIRLRGGPGPNEGYVEVQGILPGWGIVCDSRNSWTLKEAHILCRQLGYIRGAEMAWQGRNNRNGMPNWVAANTVTCFGNETRFQSCKFTHNQECQVARDAIGVRCAPNRIAHCRKDEIPHNGNCYHLAHPDSGLNHAEALEHCTRRNARLIDIASQAENNFVSELLLLSYPEVDSIMTSGFGFTTMNRTLWLWADAAHAKFKFTKWWPGWMNDTKQPPWVGYRPLCIVMKRKFPCYERPESTCDTDYFFWDTEDCAANSKEHFFICKRPYDDIGCTYGKGNQYTGKANVTVSGNKCLSWADERIAHQLHVNVVNKEVRDKLKMHNYCRNPNPGKESRPWCFTGPGKYEYCDIPACGNIDPKRSMLSGQCKPKHFECMAGECIPSPWVCDGEEDCTNGADERNCMLDLNLFQKSAKHKLEGYDTEKWLNTPLKTCALRCKEADFTCRSFNHKSDGNVCLLSNSNIGLTGALEPDKQFDYYEMRERSLDCNGMYICNNNKCINQTQVCDGKNDCNDRSDEDICTAENLDYSIRLAGADNSYEGRIEVKILGVWGQVCDDGFGMINADVICKELGFDLGALEVRSGGFYGNLDPPTRFMVDQLKCRGNETTLRECDFNGWGIHNCQPEEAVGVVCKTAVNTCQEGHWKCDNSPTCIPTPFICDEVVDCPDRSDESPEHCDAPFELRLANGSSSLQGRVEVRHHGVWGTVCDDDFTNATATVICRSLGYGGIAIAKKDGFFGPGQGPIWLDEVFCHGNESQLYRCEHNHWGQHNCDHNEDAGVICSPGNVNNAESYWINNPELPERNIDELLPSNCGQRAKDFNDDDDLIFQKVVQGSIAPKGTYPWQASIRVRGHSRSSHWCGAIMISPLHLLTAAHCLEGYNKGTYFVRAGDYNTDIDEGTEAEANIEDYYVHEEFRKGHRMNNDIALILLKGHGIPLGKDIMPICLPSENTDYSPGLNCTISGFGSIETGKTTQSKNLRYGWVPLLDQSVCRASYVYGEGAISEGMMCAGYLDEGIDTCDGDSGGPLACYHNGAFTLYGITSWGQHCGKANKPGVYVRVAHYRRWIDQKIKESLAEQE